MWMAIYSIASTENNLYGRIKSEDKAFPMLQHHASKRMGRYFISHGEKIILPAFIITITFFKCGHSFFETPCVRYIA